MNSLRIYTILILTLLFSLKLYAQYFSSANSWKKYRNEIYIGIGAANFLGDLGGKDQTGKDYSYADTELSLTRPSATIGYRYRITKNLGWRTDINYMKLWGDDALTKDPFRNNRNLKFKTNIFELSTNVELVWYISKGGNRYQIKNTRKSRYKSANHYIYCFMGIGIFYFNPKNEYNGKWYALQPLSTEGQGLPGGASKYKRVSVSIPLGAGYRFNLTKKLTLGLEYNFRKTFTDYIDDVHGTYYDNTVLNDLKGPVAATLADPSLGSIPGATNSNGDGTGAQRGDKQYDSYFSLEIKLGYMIKSVKRKKLRMKF